MVGFCHVPIVGRANLENKVHEKEIESLWGLASPSPKSKGEVCVCLGKDKTPNDRKSLPPAPCSTIWGLRYPLWECETR